MARKRQFRRGKFRRGLAQAPVSPSFVGFFVDFHSASCSNPTRAVPDVDGYTTVLIRVTGCRQFSIQLADRDFTSIHALAADDQDTGD